MAKPKKYSVRLFPAHRSNGFITTTYKLFGDYPQREITAAGLANLLGQIAEFTQEHGKACCAQVTCVGSRKPPGFDNATRQLVFNLE